MASAGTRPELRTRICDVLGVDVPLANAGMGPFARAPLAAAVANAGGLGSLGGRLCPVEELVEMIEEARSLTDGPLAMNLIPRFQDMEMIAGIVATGIDVIAIGWSDPAPIVKLAHDGGVKVMHRCVNAAEAAHAAECGVDVIIAQGLDAGGHTGEIPGMGLLPAVVDAADGVPVVYAGGIGDGRGLVAALALGADGVIMGTRFVASRECHAHDVYKGCLVAASEADSVENEVFGWREWPEPTRALRNSTLRAYEQEPEPRTPIAERPLEVIARRHLTDEVIDVPRYYLDAPWPQDEGEIEAMALYAGTSVGLVNDILPAAEIVERVMVEAGDTLDRLGELGPRRVTSR
jgi:NAD(P)H-dependent flavin oxidoreductase YrpB (nitropropane dioxygenase family)